MPSVDEELNQIERDIRTLKIEFEQYFGGGRSRPPNDTQWRVETSIRRYSDRSAEMSSGQRFRYSNLTQTYVKYQDMWRKKLAQKEGGVTQHHYGSAAKAIEAERARKAAESKQSEPAEPVAVPASHHHAELEAAHVAESRKAARFAMAFSDPEHERDKVALLYEKLVEARSETGERAGVPSLKDFEKFVQQKTSDLKAKGGREIEYTVSVEAGKVKLKARVST
ncbi:MAG: MXAN_5187 C-terminal domain-containing protein [Candidatus Acidiferrales bacterium]